MSQQEGLRQRKGEGERGRAKMGESTEIVSACALAPEVARQRRVASGEREGGKLMT